MHGRRVRSIAAAGCLLAGLAAADRAAADDPLREVYFHDAARNHVGDMIIVQTNPETEVLVFNGGELALEGGSLVVVLPALDVGKAYRREADDRLFHLGFPQQQIKRDGGSDCTKQQCGGDGAVERGSTGEGFSSPIRSRQASSSDSWR